VDPMRILQYHRR